jgi:hypothetical protein
MKRFYFLQYNGQVFALEPHTRTLITTAPPGAGAPRLIRATLDTLGIPTGRRHVRKAPIWLFTPLRILIEAKLNKERKIGEPMEVVYPYTTPLTKPLVAFLASESWTLEQQREWEEQERIKNTKKKKSQRDRVRDKKIKNQPAKVATVQENHGLEEETE